MTNNEKSELAKQQLDEIISELENNPNSLAGLMQFNKFLSKLKYGTISKGDLDAFYERANNIEGSNGTIICFKLLDYSVKQIVALQ